MSAMLTTMIAIAVFKEHDPTHEPIYITVILAQRKRKRTMPVSLHRFHGLLMKSTNFHCRFILDDGAIIFRVGFDCDGNYLPTSLGQTIPDFSPQQILTELVGGR